jgi:hypothetical protein
MLSVGFSLAPNDFKKKKKNENQSGSSNQGVQYSTMPAVDYSNPWSLNLSYNLTYSNRFNQYTQKYIRDTVQSLSISGDIAITKKWKFRFTTGYDFEHKDFSYTSIEIYRDLHCWEMVLNWIPIGFRKSYNFTIRVKASVLQDLKLTKKTDWRDYY